VAEVKHKNRKHALLSASGASRWLSCTPSARLEEEFGEDSRSAYAAEGTLAHEFGDLELKLKFGFIKKAEHTKQRKRLEKNEFYSSEMDDEVDKYVEYVSEQFAMAKREHNGATLIVEERVDLTEYIEEGFGTCDANVIADETLEVIDLKYGKGVKVYADNNEQLKLYGLGALRIYDLAYDIQKVRLTIFQPRLDHYSSWEIDAEELRSWGEKEVKPKAELAYQGEGLQHAGEHCRWCKVKAKCATLASYNTSLAKHEFKSPHLLTDDLLLKVYNQLDLLNDWANAVREHFLKEAINGKKWPGYKLVTGKSNRKWADEAKVQEALKKLGFDQEKYINSKLKGIGDIEKLVGKKEFPDVLGSWVEKPEGKPTLTVESDKRPALNSDQQAKEDFN